MQCPPACGPIAAEGIGKYTDVAGHGLPGPARSDRFFQVPDAKDSHCTTETQGSGCGKARKREGGGCVVNLLRALASKANRQLAGAMLRGLQTHSTPFARFNSLQSQSFSRGERTEEPFHTGCPALSPRDRISCGAHWRASESGELPSSAGRGTRIKSSVAAQ